MTRPCTGERPGRCIDWRLLLPLPEGCRILVAGIAAAEIASALRTLGAEAESGEAGASPADAGAARCSVPAYDVVALPLGLAPAGRLAGPTARTALGALAHRLKPGGTILVGFSSPIRFRRGPAREALSLRPARMVDALERAGFGSVQLYGALPGLDAPAHVFPLQREPFAFALRRHYRERVPAVVLALLSTPLALSLLAHALPAYFATAVRARPEPAATARRDS